MELELKQITGLILAGGRGMRMGGVDKGLRPFRGATMVSHVIDRLAPQVGRLMINANQNLPSYQAYGLPVWPDELTGFEGPLAGLQTGLFHCETGYLLSAPCDSPFLPHDLAVRLSHGLIEQDADQAIAVTGEGDARQAHPVFCLMKTTLLPQLSAYLEGGGRRLESWCRSQRLAEVHFADDAGFRNINTVEELQRFESV